MPARNHTTDEKGFEMGMGLAYQTDELSFNDLQLHDALSQAGYGSGMETSW
jgi:hypothetical protein